MIQWKAIAAFVLLALVVGAGLGCYAGYHMGSLSANAKLAVMKADDAKALAKAESDARANEQLAADTLNHIQA